MESERTCTPNILIRVPRKIYGSIFNLIGFLNFFIIVKSYWIFIFLQTFSIFWKSVIFLIHLLNNF